MKKPERKIKHEFTPSIPYYDVGFNQAWDDWEKWLPSEEEIEIIIAQTNYDLPKQNFLGMKAKALKGKHFGDCIKETEPCAVCQYEEIKDLAQALAKRIRGE